MCNYYLTPDLVSDHLFKPHGNKTTIAPKMIIAYIWDIISIVNHLHPNSVFWFTKWISEIKMLWPNYEEMLKFSH